MTYLGTDKKFVSLSWDFSGISCEGVDSPSMAQFAVPMKQNHKFTMPRFLYDAYDLGSNGGVHPRSGDDDAMKIQARRIVNMTSHVPYGVSFEASDESPEIDEHLATVPFKESMGLKKLMSIETETVTVTIVMDDTRMYIRVAPYSSCDSKLLNRTDLYDYFGAQFEGFVFGALSYVDKASSFKFPTCFKRAAALTTEDTLDIKVSGDSLIITPSTMSCDIDGNDITTEQFKGEEGFVCDECMPHLHEEGAEIYRLAGQLVRDSAQAVRARNKYKKLYEDVCAEKNQYKKQIAAMQRDKEKISSMLLSLQSLMITDR
jgi:hypothetical protein